MFLINLMIDLLTLCENLYTQISTQRKLTTTLWTLTTTIGLKEEQCVISFQLEAQDYPEKVD